MSNLVPFEGGQLPTYGRTKGPVENDFASGGLGFPVMSIKGKEWKVRKGDEETLLKRKDEDGELVPATSIEAVILKVFPGKGKTSKIWYAQKFVEGSDAKPDCYSNDGETPAADAPKKQAAKCALCPKNVWGSEISEDGKQLKACKDSKRLAIAAPDKLDDPMLLRVPATSLKALGLYGKELADRGIKSQLVVVRMKFASGVAHPQLEFKPVSFLDEAAYKKAVEVSEGDTVQAICGMSLADEFAPQPEKAEAETSAPETTKTETADPVKKPEPKKAKKADDLPTEPPKGSKPVKVEEPKIVAASEGLEAALEGLDFSDDE